MSKRITIAVIGVFAFGPVYWLLVTALTPNEDVFRFPPRLWPSRVTWEHFANLADNPALARYLTNSIIVERVHINSQQKTATAHSLLVGADAVLEL